MGWKEQEEKPEIDLRRFCDVPVRLINTAQDYKVNT
jgi:hypothetical protein